ncbi:MAG: glycosyltransferase family 4 protein [Gammaproteobacteria bacterium]|nr:glycosyltransferase family 4 protein [Gammaproteobacteria bacterium]
MKKNILFLHSGGDQIRGTEFTLITVLKGLDRDAFYPIVICDSDIFIEELKSINIECHLRKFPEFMFEGSYVSFPLFKYIHAFHWLLSFCNKSKIDLLYANGGRPCQLSVPLKIIKKIPLVCQFHHPAPKRYYYIWLVKFSDRVIFPSKFTASHSKYKANLEGKVIYPGIDNVDIYARRNKRECRYRAALGIASDDVVFSQVGFVGEYKGVGLVIDAFEEVKKINPNVKLLFIGEGPEKEKYLAIVKERGLTGSVLFLGYVDSVAEHFLRVVDVNILASNEEGLGLVLLQASACRLPNIGTNGTGIKETIIHNKTGFLFKENNTVELAGYMQRLASSHKLRSDMGLNGEEMVDKKFSEKNYVSNINDEIYELIGNS